MLDLIRSEVPGLLEDSSSNKRDSDNGVSNTLPTILVGRIHVIDRLIK